MFRAVVVGLGSICLIALVILGVRYSDRIPLPESPKVQAPQWASMSYWFGEDDLSGIEARLTALENVPSSSPSDGDIEQRLSALEDIVGTIRTRLRTEKTQIDRFQATTASQLNGLIAGFDKLMKDVSALDRHSSGPVDLSTIEARLSAVEGRSEPTNISSDRLGMLEIDIQKLYARLAAHEISTPENSPSESQASEVIRSAILGEMTTINTKIAHLTGLINQNSEDILVNQSRLMSNNNSLSVRYITANDDGPFIIRESYPPTATRFGDIVVLSGDFTHPKKNHKKIISTDIVLGTLPVGMRPKRPQNTISGKHCVFEMEHNGVRYQDVFLPTLFIQTNGVITMTEGCQHHIPLDNVVFIGE